MVWEYSTLKVEYEFHIPGVLKQKGLCGWELCSIWPTQIGHGAGFMLVFKRRQEKKEEQ